MLQIVPLAILNLDGFNLQVDGEGRSEGSRVRKEWKRKSAKNFTDGTDLGIQDNHRGRNPLGLNNNRKYHRYKTGCGATDGENDKNTI